MPDRATSVKLDRSASLSRLVHELGDWSAGPGPVFRSLARAIGGAIERGALEAGERLPSERSLALAVAVSRGTAVAAYDALTADGQVERRQGSGTFVIGGGALALPPGREGSALVHRLVDQSAGRVSLIDLSISVVHDAAGLPDVSLTSADLASVVPETGYSPWGLPALRGAMARHVTAWGLPSSEGQIVVTTGAQQALSAAAACWVRPGDAVAVEAATYPGAIATFRQAGARLVGMAIDRHGVSPAAVARALDEHPALVYLQSTVHSPTGAVMPASRRREIARLVQRSRVPLVEDLALADTAWDRPPAPIAALLPDATVVVIGSLSKTFWGGLRVGFVRAPEPVALRFARVKATHDLGSSAVSQLLALRLLEAPSVERFIGDRRQELRRRYEALAAGLSRLRGWRWDPPAGGMSIWARLPRRGAESFAAAALRHGVAVATAEALAPVPGADDRVRVSFSAPPAVLAEGTRRLGAAWAEWTGAPLG